MKYIFLLITILFASCGTSSEWSTHPLPLRQLVKSADTSEYKKGAYFLIWASYSEGKVTSERIKMYAEVEGVYRLLEYPIEWVGIKIDNQVEIPYLLISSEVSVGDGQEPSDWKIINSYNNKTITLVCAEKYLPEKLLPISL